MFLGKSLLQRKRRDRSGYGGRWQQDGCREVLSSSTDSRQVFEEEQEWVILYVKMLLSVNNHVTKQPRDTL